ncbi:glutamate--tRNA ligase family protein, partial [Desulfobacterales bacterium HSG2]|nr:glutamate--tRNA ligase family protein [Desulfobacterales bacterium HSG2]
DHVNNTPRQILLYKAMGSPLPAFGHVPMVLGNDRTRLSKRHGAMSVTAYRDMGYLPDALINYLVRLGWSFGDQEFFTRDDLIEKFTLENIGKAAGIFDQEKLLALNADHIKASPPRDLIGRLVPFLKEKGIETDDTDYLESIIETLNLRSKTLKEMAEGAMFYFQDEIIYDEKAAKKFLKPNILDPLRSLKEELESLDPYTEKELEAVFVRVMETAGLKLGKIAQPVRVALTGKTASPGIFEIIQVLGKKRVLPRLEKAVQFILKKG